MSENTPSNFSGPEEVDIPEPIQDLSGPQHLDIKPSVKGVQQISKRVGYGVAGALLLMLILIIYGVGSRGNKKQNSSSANGDTSITAATDAGKQLQIALEEQKDTAMRTARDKAGIVGAGDAQANDEGLQPPPLVVTPMKGSVRPGVPRLNEEPAFYSNKNTGTDQRKEKSPEEIRREKEYDQYLAAIAAPMNSSRNGASSTPAGLQSAIGAQGGLGSLINTLIERSAAQNAAMNSVTGHTATTGDDANGQSQKEAFLQKARSRGADGYLVAARTAPISRYEIKAGWDIPATLEQEINSDLPGELRAVIRENVYDSATGAFLLIPQGSRIIGTYDHRITYGQSRVEVVWSRLLFPDGSSISLDGMVGQDAHGSAGFGDKVDHHYSRIFGMALVTSAFSAGIQLSQGNQNTGPYGQQTNSQIATQALGQQMGQLGMEIARKNLNVQPTIHIRQGYRFNVRVNRDMAFDGPYSESRL